MKSFLKSTLVAALLSIVGFNTSELTAQVIIHNPTVFVPGPIYTQPIYSAPIVVPSPVIVQQPVFMPAPVVVPSPVFVPAPVIFQPVTPIYAVPRHGCCFGGRYYYYRPF